MILQKWEKLLHVFDSYMPKQIPDADGEMSDEMFDVDDEMESRDREKYADGDLVCSEEGYN